MSYPRFFYTLSTNNDAPINTLPIASELTLEDSVFHHWCRVLRAKVGDRGILFDGYGGEILVELTAITKKTASATIIEHMPDNRTANINVCVALVMSRGDRTDYAVQKLTELGVTSIQLLTSHHGEVSLKPVQINKKLNHWQQVAISACEQCGLNIPPLVLSPIKITSWLEGDTGFLLDELQNIASHNSAYYANTSLGCDSINADESLKLILSVPNSSDENPVEVHQYIRQQINLFQAKNKRLQTKVLVGPEGGFSDAEHRSAIASGFYPWQLGERVLRAETAPVVALSALNVLSQLV